MIETVAQNLLLINFSARLGFSLVNLGSLIRPLALGMATATAVELIFEKFQAESALKMVELMLKSILTSQYRSDFIQNSSRCRIVL